MTPKINSTLRRLYADAAIIAVCVASSLNAAIYYVNPAGNDTNNGTSTGSSWSTLTRVNQGPTGLDGSGNPSAYQPGDSIRLISGGVWTGQVLQPRGSGSSGSPIGIDKYGSGAAPVINAAGALASYNGSARTESAGVWLYNQKHWEIRNLEITNYVIANLANFGTVTLTSDAPRWGIFVAAENGVGGDPVSGTSIYEFPHIYILNNTIHHVEGYDNTWTGEGTQAEKATGGISLHVLRGTNDTVPTRFRDVLIEGNNIYSVNACGISSRSLWSDDTERTPSLQVIVRNNVVDDAARDGICFRVTDFALIEFNVVSGANHRARMNGDGIWTFNAISSKFQFNEAYDTQTSTTGGDGFGFDMDYKQSGAIFQFNYSHDNLGGFFVSPGLGTLGYTSVDGVCRYNISQNDLTRIFRFSGGSRNLQIYNNTIYVSPSFADGKIISIGNWGGIWPQDIKFSNNIIHNASSSATYDLGPNPNPGTAGTDQIGGFEFNNCIFYNTSGTPSGEPVAGSDDRYTVSNKKTYNPQLVSVGSGGSGIHSLNGYKLAANSPAFDDGVVITTTNATLMPLPSKDYWGNAVSNSLAPSIGAYDGQGVNSSATLLFRPSGDALVRDGTYANTSYGSSTALEVKGATSSGYNRKALLKFDLTSLDTSSVSSAKLVLYGNNAEDGSSVTVTAYATTDSWLEGSATWNTAPAQGTSQGSTSVNGTTGYHEIDLTAYVQSLTGSGGSKIVSVLLNSSTARLVQFNSDEASTAGPVLKISGSVSRAATADAYVRDGADAANNFGTATVLETKYAFVTNYSRKAYLRFSLPAGLAGVNSAKVRIYGSTSGGTVKVRASRVTDDTWVESGTGGIVWNTSPATVWPQSTTAVSSTAQYYELDVTDFVQNELAAGQTDVTVSLKATDNSEVLVTLNSRENTANKPILLLQ